MSLRFSKALGPSCGPTFGEAEVLGFTLHQKKTPFLSTFSYLHSHLITFFVIFNIVVTSLIPYVYFEFILNFHNKQLLYP